MERKIPKTHGLKWILNGISANGSRDRRRIAERLGSLLIFSSIIPAIGIAGLATGLFIGLIEGQRQHINEKRRINSGDFWLDKKW